MAVRPKVPLSRAHRLSVTGAGDGFSNGEDVIVMFFLIRYQSIVASKTEINFARQFSRVSLVRRMEINFVRQLFDVSFFINAVQQNSRDA